MESRLHGKCPRIGHYKFPYYITIIGELINNGSLNIISEQDGNYYVKLKKEIAYELYEVLEQMLIIPKNSIEEININMENQQLDIYTFHTVSSEGLKNLRKEYRIGYGINAVGIHIPIKPELAVLMQLQICVNQKGTYPATPLPEKELIEESKKERE